MGCLRQPGSQRPLQQNKDYNSMAEWQKERQKCRNDPSNRTRITTSSQGFDPYAARVATTPPTEQGLQRIVPRPPALRTPPSQRPLQQNKDYNMRRKITTQKTVESQRPLQQNKDYNVSQAPLEELGHARRNAPSNRTRISTGMVRMAWPRMCRRNAPSNRTRVSTRTWPPSLRSVPCRNAPSNRTRISTLVWEV